MSDDLVTFRDFIAQESRESHPTQSTAFLLRCLTVYYQHRWLLGFDHIVHNKSTDLSDFTLGTPSVMFRHETDQLYADEELAQERLFSQPLYINSPLGRCREELGEPASHALAIVVLCEMQQIGRNLATTREIAWTLGPMQFHRQFADARTLVKTLFEHDLVEASGGGPIRYVAQGIAPTPQFLDEFLDYLDQPTCPNDKFVSDGSDITIIKKADYKAQQRKRDQN